MVGDQLVGAEDDFAAMADYADQMRIFAFVRGLYPKVHLSLHAGELTLGLVPPEGLCCHVSQAVETAGTDRVGHGVDVMDEDGRRRCSRTWRPSTCWWRSTSPATPMCSASSGEDHPFQTYRKYGVPVALSTDDEGIERIDLTNEYVRAVETYDLSYADLKQLARASLEHSFLPGASLWQERDVFTGPVSDCGGDAPGGDQPSASCAAFLKASEKAEQQWELERRFAKLRASF